MTFVNPAILWGLLAVSIPIIIHIFNLKKTRKIEFSTLMFLKEIQETKQKRIKLKQLLILLCRIAFIILLVLAFAGPFSEGFLGSIADKAPASVLILIDDSFSLNGRSASGTDFDAAKESVIEILNTIESSDEVYFMSVSGLYNNVYHPPYKEKNSIIDTLSSLRISDTRKTILEILFGANRVLSDAKYPLKEIYLVTDGQSSMFTTNPLPGEIILDDKTRLSIIISSERTPNNLSIDSIDIKTRIFAPGRIIRLSVIVNNHNNFNVTGRSIVFTAGPHRDEKVIDLPAGSKTAVDFSFIPVGTGFISAKAELTGNGVSEDEIPNDDSRLMVFYVPKELKVLIVSPSEGNSKYIKLALQSSEALTTDSSGNRIDYYRIAQSTSFNTERLPDVNAVVIINKNQFSTGEASKLKEYVENGGGVILYPGKDAEINNYNEVLLKELNIPFLPARTDASAVFEKVDFWHPVFEGVFKSVGNDIKLESPSITSFISPQTGVNSQSLIQLNNGQNFLVQYNIGKGKMLVYAIAPDYSTSNFPDAGIFSPLTVRGIAFVSKLPSPKEAISGEDYFFDPSAVSTETDSLKIGINDQITSKLESSGVSASILNLENYLASANIYTVTAGDRILYKFPANTDPSEALTERMNSSEIYQFLDENYGINAVVLDGTVSLHSSIREARSGKMLWQYFLIGALLLLAIEFWLSKSIITAKK